MIWDQHLIEMKNLSSEFESTRKRLQEELDLARKDKNDLEFGLKIRNNEMEKELLALWKTCEDFERVKTDLGE